MIQRIQSLLLFLVFVLGVLLYFLPLGAFVPNMIADGAKIADLNCFAYDFTLSLTNAKTGELHSYSNLPIMITTIIFSLLPLVIIFLYNNRKLQIKLVRLNVLLNIILLMILFLYINFIEVSTKLVFNYHIGTYLLIGSIIILYLASYFIKKDEEKVRAADRLRSK